MSSAGDGMSLTSRQPSFPLTSLYGSVQTCCSVLTAGTSLS